ncbi:hypothetical protein BpHYR1_050564 [Brachionus plicatilis]|uniref:Uncharacterized protein n=1 Tax=Brachionus plicatilis TaxID=10195 RepID=A0A3M7PAS8_BRAPC|nr:hypothetical protein BpHYR1_050564 [Brachionus plicatilis]
MILSRDSQFDSSVKPEAKSTPQKDQYLDSSQESNLQIDLSANESIIKENLENSTKSFSNIRNPVSSNQTSSSHNLNTDESLTITNMVESIKSAPNLGTRLETASNSDKENKEEFQIKNEVPSESDCESSKLKKTKITKLKKEANSNDEASEHTKKKKSSKSTDQNPTKKQKLSQAFQKKNSEQLNKEVSDCELDNSFSKKLNTHIGSNSNFSSNTSSSPSQLAMLQNFQLMPLMYPWKSLEYSPNFSNFQQAQQIQNQQQANNSINSQPLANFASLIQEATSYQNNVFTAKVLQNENTSMDSLKETQMKISESCSLVND